MGIYIPGMEMPTCCYECHCISTADIGVGTAYGCSVLPAFMYDPSKRLEDCPLIELPPHGRLGDLDELDHAFTALRFNGDGGLNHWDDRKNWCLHGSEIEMLLANAPTIIPADGGDI